MKIQLVFLSTVSIWAIGLPLRKNSVIIVKTDLLRCHMFSLFCACQQLRPCLVGSLPCNSNGGKIKHYTLWAHRTRTITKCAREALPQTPPPFSSRWAMTLVLFSKIFIDVILKTLK